jgi:CHAD domain-containing protein/adenylate cyclase class IV
VQTFVERELKLESPADFVLPPLDGEPLEDRVFTSTYYDSPSRSLARAGITLRRRVENGLSCWQLKLPREEGRAEISAPGGPAGPPASLRALLLAHLRHGDLEQVATLRTRRTGVRVGSTERPVADVTLDSVDILDGRKSLGAFVEVEIELVDGEPADLEQLGKTLRKAGAKRSDGRAKVMRVLQVNDAKPLGAKAPTFEQVRHILAAQLRELERYDPGVRLSDDPEDLHRFRVATRRTRAVIRATRPLLGDALAPLGRELKWLGGVLGPARDLDVLLERLRAEVQTLGQDEPGGAAIVAVLEEERERLHDAVLAALADERYFRLLDTFAASIASLPAVESPDGLRPIAATQLRKLAKAARKLGDEPTDAELHALRIRAKRARYAAELAAVGHDSKALSRYIAALKALQDVIGEHQDAVVAEAKIRRVERPKIALAAGRLIEREHERRLERRRDYPDVLARTLRRGRKALA